MKKCFILLTLVSRFVSLSFFFLRSFVGLGLKGMPRKVGSDSVLSRSDGTIAAAEPSGGDVERVSKFLSSLRIFEGAV